MTAADRPSDTDNARAEQRSEYTVQQTAAHFARKVQRVSDRIRSTDYQRSVSDIVALDNVEGFLDRIARDDLDVFAAGRAEAERPACTWPRCKSPATGKCFAWCKCICHEWSAAQQAAGRAETTTATTEATEDAAQVLYALRMATGEHTPGLRSECITDAQALADAGLLATARTRPTREQIARAICESTNPGVPAAWNAYRDQWLQDADAVLALWADQPTEAEAGARALEQAADWLASMLGETGPGNRHTSYGAAGLDIIRQLRERAARLRGGAR